MNLTTFDFNETPVRSFLDEAGEPWFVAADVCRVLEIVNLSQALSELDDDERNTLRITEGNRGNPNLNIISEAGLYDLVFRSRKPEAKAFRRWVTKEVLPAIRKTGRYALAGSGLTGSEEEEVADLRRKIEAAFADRLAGRLTNGDACALASLAAQACRLWDVQLRLRAGRVPVLGKGGEA